MKKAAFLIAFVLVIQMGFCQQTDTLKIAKDTIPASAVDTVKAVAQPVAAAPTEATSEVSATAKKDQRTMKEKFGFGLGASFWFSSDETYVEVSPTLAYRFPKMLTTGIGYRYIYQHYKPTDTDLNSYGPLAFARADMIPKIYFWTEYEYLKNKYISDDHDIDNFTSDTDSWFVGLGFTQSVGRRGGIGIQVLYNVLYDDNEYSPYYGPVIYRIGYFF
jgi:hypothetical protein